MRNANSRGIGFYSTLDNVSWFIIQCSKISGNGFHYGGKLNFDHVSLYLNGEKLKIFYNVKYLGIIFDSALKFSNHVTDVVRRCNSMIGAMSRKFGRSVSLEVLKNVYGACIRFVLDYGSIIYDPVLKTDIDELERVQKYALRLILRDFTISYEDALTRTGFVSLYCCRKRLKLCQFYKYYSGMHDFSNSLFIHRHHANARFNFRHVDLHHVNVPRPFLNALNSVSFFLR